MKFLLWFMPFALVRLFSCWAAAQVCPHGSVDQPQLVDLIKATDSAEVIYRSAAIAGLAVVPTLRTISRPRMAANTIPGAAQVSLAKLGDRVALNELRDEINNQHGGNSIGKLLQVGTDEAISILMDYLQAHLTDTSLARRYGDYTVDPRFSIVRGIASIIPDPPRDPTRAAELSYQGWVDWWIANKKIHVALSISGELTNPYLQCLARKVEWGFPDAILDMANTRNPEIIPVLGILIHVGDQAFTLNTTSGRARFALAKLGDPGEFKAIVSGLDNSGYRACIEELRFIGGRGAVAALIDDLSSSNFLPEHKQYRQMYLRELSDHDRAIEDGLAKMVVSPPETKPSPQSKKKWEDWWVKNKETAQYIIPVSVTYE